MEMLKFDMPDGNILINPEHIAAVCPDPAGGCNVFLVGISDSFWILDEIEFFEDLFCTPETKE